MGTTSRSLVKTITLETPILARFLRINPQTWYGGNISLRADILGCSQKDQFRRELYRGSNIVLMFY